MFSESAAKIESIIKYYGLSMDTNIYIEIYNESFTKIDTVLIFY
jgi:hypothetical protein